MSNQHILVLDTNVIMALWVFADPNLGVLRRYIEHHENVQLHTRTDCLDELQRVLAYSQFALSTTRQTEVWNTYAALALRHNTAIPLEPIQLPRCKDRDDQKFLELAWHSKATHLLTRDKALLRLARRPPLRDRLSIQSPEFFVRQVLESKRSTVPIGAPDLALTSIDQ